MFFYISIAILILITALIFSKIKIEISNVKITTEKINVRHLNKDYYIAVSLYILGKLRLLKINITKTRLEKLEIKNKIKGLDVELIKNKNNFNKDTLIAIKNVKPKIEYLDLKIDIGLEDAALTSYTVAVISTIVGLLLKNQLEDYKNKKFIITPKYINKNLLNLEFDCIFTVKMIHIIYIIYILKKKGRVNKNVRTPNRRTYGYSYE